MRTRNSWQTLAPYWASFEHLGARPADFERVASQGGIRGNTLLVGAGLGILYAPLKVYARRLVAIDWAAEMIRRARQVGVPVLCADAACMPFQDSCFDTIVVASGVLELDTPEAERIFGEAVRLLAPNALLHVIVPYADEVWLTVGGQIGVISGRRFSGARLFKMLAEVTGVAPSVLPEHAMKGRDGNSYISTYRDLIPFVHNCVGGESQLVADLVERCGIFDNYFPRNGELRELFLRHNLAVTSDVQDATTWTASISGKRLI